MSRSQAWHQEQPARRNITSSAAGATGAHSGSDISASAAAASAYTCMKLNVRKASMPSRRTVLAGAAALCAIHADGARAEAILTDDGLYRQPWFLESFLELAGDLDGAAQQGKRLAVIWELRGCPYCRKMHLVNFAQPESEAYIREHFEILQLNIIGAREVTDFDGERP